MIKDIEMPLSYIEIQTVVKLNHDDGNLRIIIDKKYLTISPILITSHQTPLNEQDMTQG